MKGRHSTAIDLTGTVCGWLTVIEIDNNHGRKNSGLYWKCKCQCGKIVSVYGQSLRRQDTRSCGCRKVITPSRTTHGLSRDRFYRCWKGMIERCDGTREKHKNYRDKNIKVCPRWYTFENFKEDMEGSYEAHLSIDRINNDGDYCKENCRWATYQTQAENRDVVYKVLYRGEVMSMARFGRALGYKNGGTASYYYKTRGEVFLLENEAKLLN